MIDFLAAAIRIATPLIFASLGGILSERAGVFAVGLEGMMLMGAFWGVYGADKGGSWAVGILAAMLAGGLFALVHAIWSIHLRANQIVSGMALNFLAGQKVSVNETAYLVGFSEPAAFSRAFKRWTGTSPSAARKL